MKKVAVFQFHQIPWHLSATFDVVLDHLSKGNSVDFYDYSFIAKHQSHQTIGNKVTAKYFPKFTHTYKLVREIKSRFPGTFRHFNLIKLEKINDLTQLNMSSDKIAEASKKDLIAQFSLVDLKSRKTKKMYKEKENEFKKIYSDVLRKLKDNNYQYVYTYNSRFLNEKATEMAAYEFGISPKYIERFVLNWPSKYWIFDQTVHDTKYRANVVNDYIKSNYSNIFISERLEIAKKWYEQRKAAVTQNYTKGYNQQFAKSKKNKKLITFFTSSEDELIYNNLNSKIWPNQFYAIQELYKVSSLLPNTQLVVRVHPNTRNKSKYYRNKWKQFAILFDDSEKIRFIDFHDKTSSYDLLEKSDLVVTAGSTVGIEAAILKKNSILLGEGLHSEMEICKKPNSIEDLHKMIVNSGKIIEDVNFVNAVNYVTFLERAGRKFKFAKTKKNEKSASNTQDPILYFFEEIRIKHNTYLKFIYKLLWKIFPK